MEATLPTISTWFEEAAKYIRESPRPTTVNALPQVYSRSLPGSVQDRPLPNQLQPVTQVSQSSVPSAAASNPGAALQLSKLGDQEQVSGVAFPPCKLGVRELVPGADEISAVHKQAMATGSLGVVSDTDVPDFDKQIEASMIKDFDSLPEWDRVHACPALKLKLQMLFDRHARDNSCTRADGMRTHGMLFYGRPGTGKSLLAKAVARYSKFNFYDVAMGDIISMWQGGSGR